MKKTKKLLSLLTALAISVSAFTGLVIPASADDDDAAVSPAFSLGKLSDADTSASMEWVDYQGKENVLHIIERNAYATVNDISTGTANFNTNVYLSPTGGRTFRIVLQNATGEVYDQDTAFAQVAVNGEDNKIYVGPDLANTGSGTELFTPTAAGWYNIDVTLDYDKKDTAEFITVVAKDAEGATLGTQQIGAIAEKDTTLKAIRLVKTASPVYFADMQVTPASAVTAATPVPTKAPATEPPAPATPKPDGEGSQNNSISINENFDGANGAVDGEGYTWADAVIGTDFGGSNKALSLTANKDKTILAIANGAGGPQKDVTVSIDAGRTKGYGQNLSTWELVFKSTDAKELFKLVYRNEKDTYRGYLSLEVGDVSKEINNYTDGKYTTANVNISFGPNGGKVTVGNTTLAFAEGSDLGTISVTYDEGKDWDRAFFVDNFKLNTVEKEKVTLNIKSNEEGQSVEGAELTIGDDVYTVPESGVVEAYYLPGNYEYSLKLAKHKAVSDTLKVVKPGGSQTTYTFENIDNDIATGTLIKAVYEDGKLKNVEAKDVPISGGKYEVSADDASVKYMLWNALTGMEPLGTLKTETVALNNDKNITLEYVGDPVPTKLVLGGGEEYIYLPEEGQTTTSKAFTAVVYDQSDMIMDNAEVVWSIVDDPAGISIADGVVTLAHDFQLTDDNGVNVTVKATVKDTQVSEDVSLHIHNTARATTWDIVGPAVIKDGTKATYKVENVKDQYKNDFKGETSFVLSSSDENAVIEGLSITPNVGVTRTEEVTITAALSTNEQAKIDRTVTVYGYDYYEPGTGQATYGAPRMEVVNDVNSVVWPKGGQSTTITLPVPVALTPGSAKMITFDNIIVNKEISAQERSLKFLNSADETVIEIGFAGTTVVKDYAKVDGSFGGTEIGKTASFGEAASATFVVKTDMDGKSSAILKYNEGTLAEFELEKGTDIAKIVMTSGSGVPDERLLTLTNVLIADNDVPEVEIVGDDKLAKISGLVATKKFKGSIFSKVDGETFTWSVAGKDGNPINGVTINQEGVLSVTDAVAADTVAVISYTSSLSTEAAPKFATHEVTIKDFAAVKSFDIDGPVAVNAGETVTYVVKNVVDEYGDKVTMPVSFAITAGDDVAAVDAKTGVVTTTGKLGKYTVAVTVGNPGKTTTKSVEAEVAVYSAIGDASGSSVEVDVTALANYAADTKYRVTTATADGKLVKQIDDVAHTSGKVTVDTTGAAKYEVSPIYSYNNLSGVSSSGKKIPLCDGLYDFTFKKSNGSRSDILVNGNMVGQNVDQYGLDRGPSGSYYSVKDVVVQGGSADVTMGDNKGSDITSIVVKKAPSIVTRKTHVYILGDSLVANYYSDVDSQYSTPDNYDAQTGWGQVLHKFISAELNVTNLAESGSTVVRDGSVGLFETAFPSVLALAKPGDYLIWEAGYNDSSYSSESKMAAALQIAADECKLAGVNLILSTPNFGPGHGTTNGANVRFGPKVLEVAKDNGILGVNLSGDLYAKYAADTNADKATYWNRNFHAQSGGKPDLHMSYRGAIQNACVVAQAIYNAQKDTENAELAASLQNLKISMDAQTVTDADGATLTFQVK